MENLKSKNDLTFTLDSNEGFQDPSKVLTGANKVEPGTNVSDLVDEMLGEKKEDSEEQEVINNSDEGNEPESDENNNEENLEDNETDNENSEQEFEQDPDESSKKLPNIPYSRFSKINKQKNEYKTKLEEMEAELESLRSEKESKEEEIINNNSELDEFDETYDESIASMAGTKKINSEMSKIQKEISELKEMNKKLLESEKRNAEKEEIDNLIDEAKTLQQKTVKTEYPFDFNNQQHIETVDEIRSKFPNMTVENAWEYATKVEKKVKPKTVKKSSSLSDSVIKKTIINPENLSVDAIDNFASDVTTSAEAAAAAAFDKIYSKTAAG